MVISAYNEEAVLEEKIKNCLEIDYSQDKIKFLFGSDGSTDRTNQILSTVNHPQIQFRIFPEREGKSSVLNKLITEISDEIILFSDANSMYQPCAVRLLVSHFSDPGVGGVCGKLKLINPSGTPGGEGEGLYWRFENQIKESEGTLKSVISANGAILAVRKELLDPLPTQNILNDDFEITLQILRKMSRVVYEPKAVAEESTSPDMEGEFVRKIRISSLNFNALPGMLPLLHPKYGFTALAIFSHKLVRWMVPLLGLGMLISNLLLLNQGGIYPYLLAGQGLVYFGALLGFLGDQFFATAGPFIPFYYLAMINTAILIGLWRSLTGTQKQAWERIPH
jgi:biofilm PGA synthesis N-glycosyltransferase PgaC